MARLNEILVGRFARFFQKHYGIKGPVPVATLAPEIMPVHPILVGAEARFTDGWNRFAAVQLLPATAAVVNNVLFRNPANSNTIAVIERIKISSATAQQINLGTEGPGQGDLGSFVTAANMDVRQATGAGGTGTPVVKTSFNTSAAALVVVAFLDSVLLQASIESNLIWFEDQEIAVPQGMGVALSNNTVNTTLNFAIWWRERFLEEAERT